MDNELEKKSVFKNKNFMLLFFGGFVSNLGTTIFNFAISLYILELTDSAGIAGAYMATGGLIYFVLAPFGGAIVDRLNKIKVVYITDFIRGVTVLLAFYFIIQGISVTNQVIMLFVVTIILSLNSALFVPSVSALPAHILDEDLLQQGNSLNQGAGALYAIIGAVIGAVIYDNLGIEFIFMLNGISFILSGASEMFIKINTYYGEQIKISINQAIIDIKEGLKYLFEIKPILHLVLIASVMNFFTTPTIANGLPYLFEKQLEVESIYYSIFMAVFPLGIVISSIYLGSKKQGDKIYPMIRKGTIGMTFFFTIFVASLLLLLEEIISFEVFMISGVILILLVGAFNAFVNIPFGVAIQKTVDKEKMGRVFSVIGTISMGLTPISIGLGGVVIEFFGLGMLFIIGALALIVVTFVMVSDKQVKRL